MTSRKSKKELYDICKELKVQYIVYEGGWCLRGNAGQVNIMYMDSTHRNINLNNDKIQSYFTLGHECTTLVFITNFFEMQDITIP